MIVTTSELSQFTYPYTMIVQPSSSSSEVSDGSLLLLVAFLLVNAPNCHAVSPVHFLHHVLRSLVFLFFFSLSLFDVQLLFLNTYQKMINGVG